MQIKNQINVNVTLSTIEHISTVTQSITINLCLKLENGN